MDIKLSTETLKRLQQLRIHLRRAILGQRQGIHRSIRRGHGLEFAEFKAYTPGDDFRSVDWNAYARTDRLYTRQYREEQDVKVLIVLDFSKSVQSNSLSSKLALALAYIALSSGDRVSLLLPGVFQSAWSSTPGSYSGLVQALENNTPVTDCDFLENLGKASSQMKVPGKVFIISDLLFPLDDLINSFEYLYKKNFECSLIALDTFSQFNTTDSALLIDSETKEELDIGLSEQDAQALKLLHLKHFTEIERACSKYNFSHVSFDITTPLDIALFDHFIKGGIIR